MRIALLEDDRAEAEQFNSALKSWDPTRSAEWFISGQSLLAAADSGDEFTVAFLDIYLPKESGIEVAARLKELSPQTYIVFTTTSAEYAVEAFGLGAVHYLVKPVSTDDIREVFARISCKNSRQSKMFTIKCGREQRAIYLDKLVSLSSADHFTELQLTGGERIKVFSSLSDLVPNLDDRFLKIRRGYILNMDYIDSMTAESCRLFNGEVVLLSRKDRQSIRNTYNAWVFKKISRRRE